VNLVGCDILVLVDSTGKPNGGVEILSLMVSLDKLEGAVSMEETLVDADGDSDLAMGTVHGCCWSMSGLGFACGFILPVL
jgi:hypothetical protein